MQIGFAPGGMPAHGLLDGRAGLSVVLFCTISRRNFQLIVCLEGGVCFQAASFLPMAAALGDLSPVEGLCACEPVEPSGFAGLEACTEGGFPKGGLVAALEGVQDEKGLAGIGGQVSQADCIGEIAVELVAIGQGGPHFEGELGADLGPCRCVLAGIELVFQDGPVQDRPILCGLVEGDLQGLVFLGEGFCGCCVEEGGRLMRDGCDGFHDPSAEVFGVVFLVALGEEGFFEEPMVVRGVLRVADGEDADEGICLGFLEFGVGVFVGGLDGLGYVVDLGAVYLPEGFEVSMEGGGGGLDGVDEGGWGGLGLGLGEFLVWGD
jgi:hypothetical protein